jgi:ribosomal protein S18 acetylase RimI-like enzyme
MDPKNIIIEQVKEFSPEVVEAISGFTRQLGDSNQEFTDQTLREIIASEQSYLFIARDVSIRAIAGMIMLSVYRIPYTKKAYADDLFIGERFRHRGIGTMLMQKVVAVAKENHAAYIEFTSSPHRIAGNSLYKKLGFTKRDTNVYRLQLSHEEN